MLKFCSLPLLLLSLASISQASLVQSIGSKPAPLDWNKYVSDQIIKSGTFKGAAILNLKGGLLGAGGGLALKEGEGSVIVKRRDSPISSISSTKESRSAASPTT